MESGHWTVKFRHLVGVNALLCVSCTYCVLSQALNRHLKDIHKLTVPERQPYLDIAETLRLANAEDIVYPSRGSAPIPGLPVLDGYECHVLGCEHRRVAAKRMQAHLRHDHTGNADDRRWKEILTWRVKLQTLFKGKGLRYFVVDSHPGRGSMRRRPPVAISRVVPMIASPVSNRSETLLDWRLTYQFYKTSYQSVLPVKSTIGESWRDQVLAVSAYTVFLRYAVLSITAHQIATENLESRQLYAQEAGRYHHLALKALTAETSIVDPDNFFALFNFSRLMTVCCLARVRLDALQNGNDDTPTIAGSILPEWFAVQLQGRALMLPHRGGGRIVNAMHGPAEKLYTANRLPRQWLRYNTYDGRLQALATNLQALPTATMDPACLEALDILRRCWAVPFAAETLDLRDVALMWVVRVPPRYLDLLRDHVPVALVVFAYYCVMWSLAEGDYWYMRGHAIAMLHRIIERLHWQWHEWITWPASTLLASKSIIASASRPSVVHNSGAHGYRDPIDELIEESSSGFAPLESRPGRL